MEGRGISPAVGVSMRWEYQWEDMGVGIKCLWHWSEQVLRCRQMSENFRFLTALCSPIRVDFYRTRGLGISTSAKRCLNLVPLLEQTLSNCIRKCKRDRVVPWIGY